jgi:hypothetical protein
MHREEEERTRDREICATTDKAQGCQACGYVVFDREIFGEDKRPSERIH